VKTMFPASLGTSPSTLVDKARNLCQFDTLVDFRPASVSEIKLSIVIPAYNEQERLPRTVMTTLHYCAAQKLDFELIIVDDGSTDGTLSLVRLYEKSDGRIRALACPHAGKGSAVRLGMLNARGQFVLFMDADGATPLHEIATLAAALESGNDVAVGSRVIHESAQVEVHTSLHRRLIGRLFAMLVNLFALRGIADTQCGFKMFRRSAALQIFSLQKLSGFAFDVEILFIARRLSLTIVEIPINWAAQPGSKVNLVTDSMKMLWDISLIRWIHRKCDSTRVAASVLRLSETVKARTPLRKA
jgi:dolichyl-phosphate beta-glucosyltransferase